MGMVGMFNRDRCRGRVEGLLLIAIGFTMLYFVYGGNYWTLLNPKFKGLTAVTGYVLEFIGLALCLKAKASGHARILVLSLMFVILLYINFNNETNRSVNPIVADSVARQVNQRISRVQKTGQDYIKINLGELFDIAEGGEDAARKQHYLVRGEVQDNPRLAEKNEFVLLRTAVSCCMADAVSVGFRVVKPKGTDWQPGQWVNVYGKLVPISIQNAELQLHLLRLNGAFFTNIHNDYMLEADLVEAIERPDVPLMFQFETAEPYAY